MQILGIGDHISCGSALVRDGRVISAINDERLVREKMVFGVPRESIKATLEIHGVSPKDIDGIAIGTRRQHLIDHYVDYRDGWFGLERGQYKKVLFQFASRLSKYHRRVPFLQDAFYLARQPAFIKRRMGLRRILREEFGFSCPIRFLDHHFCHAASAYYTSDMRTSTVFTLDGGGDGNSGKVYDVVDGQFRELKSISSFDSLGCLYSYITQLCGFKAGRHEGKITGLAAFGEPIYLREMEHFLVSENGGLKNTANVFFLSALKELERVLPEDFSHRDLAASVQAHSEHLVTELVKYWVERTQHRDVGYAGGVAANVKINQRIHELPCVNSIFIHPGMSDEGMPVGAALAMYFEMSGEKYDPERVSPMEHVYLGPEYSDQDIREELERQGVAATRYDYAEAEIARLLAKGAVVARFNGRMEYGPRALGNRSVLHQPTDPTVVYWMNEAMKKRTEFMPFAPVVMAEYASQCFKNIEGAENTARFMTITFDCTDWLAQNCPGVVHADRTARPQLVSERDNPSMYRILAEYRKLTGLPVLINTSFNMHEEPIVCSPYDAIRSFQVGGIDYLAIGNWIARSPNPAPRVVDRSKRDAAINRRGLVQRTPPKSEPVKIPAVSIPGGR